MRRPRRVVFVNRYFHPDHSATSQIASDLAFHLAARGWPVEVITSRQRYDDPAAALRSGTERGVVIHRVLTTRFGRASLAGRAVDYLTFFISAFFALMRHTGRRSVVVALTDPPLISVVAAVAAALRGAALVNWVHDLFPEVALALGVRVPRFLRPLRDWSLRRARANVVLGTRMAARVPNAVVIHNWADAGLAPVARHDNPLRDAWGLGDAFVVGYSGNLGRAHEFESVLRAAAALPEVRFLVIGGGAKMSAVREAAGPNMTFLPYQRREILSSSLSAADVHLVSLQPAVEGLIVPSKLYGILAVGRPVIFIGASDGEVAAILRELDCGLTVAPDDAAALEAAIRKLSSDPQLAAAMGRRGREAYLARFAPEHAFRSWERLLEEAA